MLFDIAASSVEGKKESFVLKTVSRAAQLRTQKHFPTREIEAVPVFKPKNVDVFCKKGLLNRKISRKQKDMF